MPMHQVEVDEEVFEFIKAHAEPLVDTFNSTLRRLLPLSEKRAPGPGRGGISEPTITLPSFPNRTPQALRQILEVVYLVVAGGYTRSAATHYVARNHKPERVAPQTVIDKYTRQLNLNADEFDQLLEKAGLADLDKLLKTKFPGYSHLIDEIIISGEKKAK